MWGGKDTIPYWKTAASEAVEYLALSALGQSIFATTSIPSSVVIKRTLLKPPSILSILQTETPFFIRNATTSHNFRMSKSTRRFRNCYFLSIKDRPLGYWKSASSLIDLPRWNPAIPSKNLRNSFGKDCSNRVLDRLKDDSSWKFRRISPNQDISNPLWTGVALHPFADDAKDCPKICKILTRISLLT